MKLACAVLCGCLMVDGWQVSFLGEVEGDCGFGLIVADVEMEVEVERRGREKKERKGKMDGGWRRGCGFGVILKRFGA
ncbi:hypothetical protein IWX46DRAFT_615402 [Phyllosticta citricarpa]|uniref:Secreted protein n=1 Tax=Phyllosticta citricarpa TaxID=55181 RepID=A0ABR1L7I1_9PEZI